MAGGLRRLRQQVIGPCAWLREEAPLEQDASYTRQCESDAAKRDRCAGRQNFLASMQWDWRRLSISLSLSPIRPCGEAIHEECLYRTWKS